MYVEMGGNAHCYPLWTKKPRAYGSMIMIGPFLRNFATTLKSASHVEVELLLIIKFNFLDEFRRIARV